MKQLLLTVLLLATLGAAHTHAAGGRIALLPVEDMSHGQGARVHEEIAAMLAGILEEKNLQVVSHDTLIAFLANHRIRTSGALTTNQLAAIRKQLGADLVLLTTITQHQHGPPAELGFILSLVRCDDARTVWSTTASISQTDLQQILGLAEPSTINELLAYLEKEITDQWPQTLALTARKKTPFQVEKFELMPSFAQPGKIIDCSLALPPLWAARQPEPEVYVWTNGFLHRAEPTPNGRYEASWLAARTSGSYQVHAVVRWPDGNQDSSFLGEYRVDGMAPRFSFDIKGVDLTESVALRDKVYIVPKFHEPEPISRWYLEIVNQDNKRIFNESGSGEMPNRFFWKGRGKVGRKVASGTYSIRLKAWDRAGNMAESQEQVLVSRVPPKVNLDISQNQETMTVEIRPEGAVPLAYWQVEIYTPEGALIKSIQGKDQGSRIDLDLADEQLGSEIQCVVAVADILGNRNRRYINDLYALLPKETVDVVAEVEQVEWMDDF